MKVEIQNTRPSEGDLARLAELLTHEGGQYRRLLRLARRQNSYMKRQDVDRLEANSREWNRYLPLANQAKSAREKFVIRMNERLGIPFQQDNIIACLKRVEPAAQREIRALLAGIKNTAEQLARQNELNRSLAEFCLELAQEEHEIFKRCVLDDPSGCYGEDARRSDRGPGGVLVRQA